MSSSSATTLATQLLRIRRRAAIRAATAAAAGGLARILLLIAIIFFLDAWSPMPLWMRASLLAVVSLLLARTLCAAWSAARRESTSLASTARRAEAALGLTTNPLINALQLSPYASDSNLQGTLAHRSQATGETIGQTLPSRRAELSRDTPIAAPTLRFALAAAVLLALASLAPGIFKHGLHRIFTPWQPHPAYGALQFTIRAEPKSILIGDDLRIHVSALGSIEGTPRLLIRSATGTTPLDLHPSTDGSWHADLRSIHHPLTIHAEAGSAVSEIIEINPIRRARITRAAITIRPPAESGRAPLTHNLIDAPETHLVLAGSTIEVQIDSNLPLTAAGFEHSTVLFTPEFVQAERRISFIADALTPGQSQLAYRAIPQDGEPSDEVITVDFEILPDQPPTIEAHAASDALPLDRPVILSIDEQFPIHANATDDVGLSLFGLAWTRLDSLGRWLDSGSFAVATPDLPRFFPPPGAGASLDFTLIPQSLPLNSGDRLFITIHAHDTRAAALGGAQVVLFGPVWFDLIESRNSITTPDDQPSSEPGTSGQIAAESPSQSTPEISPTAPTHPSTPITTAQDTKSAGPLDEMPTNPPALTDAATPAPGAGDQSDLPAVRTLQPPPDTTEPESAPLRATASSREVWTPIRMPTSPTESPSSAAPSSVPLIHRDLVARYMAILSGESHKPSTEEPR